MSSMASTRVSRPSSARPRKGDSRSNHAVDVSPSRPNRDTASSTTLRAAMTEYQPPEVRLMATVQECQRLDVELQVIENSGHIKLGEFAKPLGNQQRCALLAARATQDATRPLGEPPVIDACIEDDDVTKDPLFHRFYDEDGRSISEQLLRARMRALALAKLAFGCEHLEYVRAEMELADAYARLNLWKQAHTHVMVAHDAIKAMDVKRAEEVATISAHLSSCDKEKDTPSASLVTLLEFFYDQHRNGNSGGMINIADLDALITSLGPASIDSSLTAVLEPSNIRDIFGDTPTLHWQQLLLRLEHQSSIFKDYIHEMEASLPDTIRITLEQVFSGLDPSNFGTVSLQALICSLNANVLSFPAACILAKLQQHVEQVGYPSVTWSEVLALSRPALLPSKQNCDLYDEPARELRPRLKYFFGRFFLRKGQMEDAVRYLQVALAEKEAIHGEADQSLVPMYIVLAEALAVRFKQAVVVSQQKAFMDAEAWLKSIDGSRRLRLKALEIIDDASTKENRVVSKKEADVEARDVLIKEYASLSCVRPDPSLIDDAIEACTKAWKIQEQGFGREHITTAQVHTTLAQIYAIKNNWVESVRGYENAIAIYEASCNGPVPASSFLRLEIAKIYHLHHHEPEKAAALYLEIAEFFHSFALEFASSNSTRRESCMQAIDSWRQWLALSAASLVPGTTMDKQKKVRVQMHDAVVDGYGEFSVEAAESGKELAQFLVTTGQLRQAIRYLRVSSYIFESHFGSNDRRYRRTKKELMTITSELKSALDPEETETDDHAWLTM